MSTAPSNNTLRTINGIVTTTSGMMYAKRLTPSPKNPPEIVVRSARAGTGNILAVVSVAYLCAPANTNRGIAAIWGAIRGKTDGKYNWAWGLYKGPIEFDGRQHDLDVPLTGRFANNDPGRTDAFNPGPFRSGDRASAEAFLVTEELLQRTGPDRDWAEKRSWFSKVGAVTGDVTILTLGNSV